MRKPKYPIWQTYKDIICIVIATILITGSLCLAYYYCRSDIHAWFLFYCKYVAGYVLLGIAIFFLVKFCIFLFNQQYIPLTQDELKEHNITTIDDYILFLSKSLKGFAPKRFLNEISFTMYKYLMSDDDKRVLYDKTISYAICANIISPSMEELDSYTQPLYLMAKDEKHEFLEQLLKTIQYEILHMQSRSHIFEVAFIENNKAWSTTELVLWIIAIFNLIAYCCLIMTSGV